MKRFMFLNDAMITSSCYNTKDPITGLNLTKDYMCKTLYDGYWSLVSLAFRDKDLLTITYKSILLDKLGINEGMLMENIVAQLPTTNKHNLFYYAKMIKKTEKSYGNRFLITDGSKLYRLKLNQAEISMYLNKFLNNLAKEHIKAMCSIPKMLMLKVCNLFATLYGKFALI